MNFVYVVRFLLSGFFLYGTPMVFASRWLVVLSLALPLNLAYAATPDVNPVTPANPELPGASESSEAPSVGRRAFGSGAHLASTIATLIAMSAAPEIKHQIRRIRESGGGSVEDLSRAIRHAIAEGALHIVDSSSLGFQLTGGILGTTLARQMPVPQHFLARRLATAYLGYFTYMGWELLDSIPHQTLSRLYKDALERKDSIALSRVSRMTSYSELFSDSELLKDYAREIFHTLTTGHELRDALITAAERITSAQLIALYVEIALGARTGYFVTGTLANALWGARAGSVAGWLGAVAGLSTALVAGQDPEIGRMLARFDSVMTRSSINGLYSYSNSALDAVSGAWPEEWWRLQRNIATDPDGRIAASVKACEYLTEAEKARGRSLWLEFVDTHDQLRPDLPHLISILEENDKRQFLNQFLSRDPYVEYVVDTSIKIATFFEQKITEIKKIEEQGLNWIVQREKFFREVPGLEEMFKDRRSEATLETVQGILEQAIGERMKKMRPFQPGVVIPTYRGEMTVEDLVKDLVISTEDKKTYLTLRAREALRQLDSVHREQDETLTRVRGELELRRIAVQTRQLEAAHHLAQASFAVLRPGNPCGSNGTRKMATEVIMQQLNDLYRVTGIFDRAFNWTGDPLQTIWYRDFIQVISSKEETTTESQIVAEFIQQQDISRTLAVERIQNEIDWRTNELQKNYFQETALRYPDLQGEALREAVQRDLSDESRAAAYIEARKHEFKDLESRLAKLVSRNFVAEVDAAIPKWPEPVPLAIPPR